MASQEEEVVMRVIILAGGLGTRLAEETEFKPKPMVEIGSFPILWHIMKHYAHYGFKEFVVALGYKGEVIKRFFLDYRAMRGSLTVHLATGDISRMDDCAEDWTVHLVDTGLETQTGGRIKRLIPGVVKETFMVTYGDGVSNVDLHRLLAFHRSHKRLATITAVRPAARFGVLTFKGDRVTEFAEKPQIGEGWVNGGYFVLEPGVVEYILGDEVIWERAPLERLAEEGQLMAYKHESFWHGMDTLRDVRLLRSLWDSGKAPWKVWE